MSRSRPPARIAAAALTGVLLVAAAVPAVSATAATGATASGATTAPSATNTPAPGGISITGETSPVHDPALIVDDEDGTWYVYSTGLVNRENGGTVQIWASEDEGTTWEYEGTVWDQIPAWIDEHFADGELPGSLWAPEIFENDGTYYLYYSASRFGTNNSVTALATNTTLDPEDPDYEWVDQGPVITSPNSIENNKTFNAIDAGIVEDADGTPYMAIGSFWYGIFMVELEWPSGKLAPNALENAKHVVDRFMWGNPVEAPYVYERDGWYYMFVSFNFCCRGADSTYQVAVGRSRSVTGPFLDMDGRDMFGGGGTVILEAHGAMVGPGGQSVHDDVLAFHYYDALNEEIPFFPTLGLHRLGWEDGWPVVDQTVGAAAISAGPQDLTVRPGRVATFSATAEGTPRPLVLWETSADGGATWQSATGKVAVDGATSTLSLGHVNPTDDGLLVRATATNAHGRETSEPAGLTVQLRP
ncbi:glycoside hydrolase family 43 protein [Antribacter gilvus]|uniref:glycoside hydrolase family 43 protein n=1 Tax=Antribacter gilvus TaxID=2304675 RepID=UPI000F791793|nr:glycoside hydrolase family 43 protein [Antribacter gilvus]